MSKKRLPQDVASLTAMLKEGTRHYKGTEDATIRNIRACGELSEVVRTSLGPNGRNKMVINHLERLSITSDAAAIIKELEVEHPAANMVVMASKQQEAECGDSTNFVVVFAGELLNLAEGLLRMGLHVSDVIAGYEVAGKKALEALADITVDKVTDVREKEQVHKGLRACIGAKQSGWEDLLVPVVTQACQYVLPRKSGRTFNVDSVRVCKVLGASVADTHCVKGFALVRDVMSTIRRVEGARIAVLAAGLDVAKPETKGTVLITEANELEKFAKGEEEQIEQIVKELKQANVNVVVSGGAVSDIALHFLERAKMMVVKEGSKFNLRRICRATGARPLVRVGAPSEEEIGHCAVVSVSEMGSTNVLRFEQDEDRDSGVSTIIVRGSTDNVMDDVERCIDDGVNCFKTLIRDGRLLPGAGAAETALATIIGPLGDSTPGLEQYAINKYAEALQVIPRTLAENAGLDSMAIISSLSAAHAKGQSNSGVDVVEGKVFDAKEAGILDSYLSKWWALKLSTIVAISILRIDQIIMSKRAGGPKVPEMGARDA